MTQFGVEFSLTRWHVRFVLVGCLLLVAAIIVCANPVGPGASPVYAQDGGEGTPEPDVPSDLPGGLFSDNENYCVLCHADPERSATLGDGTELSLHVDLQVLADSVHGTALGANALDCKDCHGEDIFPHDGPTPEGSRSFTINAAESCSTCHNQLLADSAHIDAIAAGNLEAATCVDCHGAHDVEGTATQVDLVAGVCGDCHVTTHTEWELSPHSGMDRLGCAVCHRPHGQQLVHEDTTTLCLSCHRVPGENYVHNTHLASVFLVSCTSCHMNYDPDIEPLSPEGEPTDHQMVVQITSCNDCHQELEETGVMDQLTGNAELTAERDELQEQVADLEAQIESAPTVPAESEDDSGNGTNIALFVLALVIGLVLGIGVILIAFPNLRE